MPMEPEQPYQSQANSAAEIEDRSQTEAINRNPSTSKVKNMSEVYYLFLSTIRKRRVLVYTIMLFLLATGNASCQVKDDVSETPNSNREPQNRVIILATTTSTQDSGLLDELVPIFEDQTGYVVKVIAVGTGQALKMGEEGNADTLLVHAPEAEKVLIENGSAIDRKLVMHNDFVIVGPPDDPAGISGLSDPVVALTAIHSSGPGFVSRGDDSGTNKKELQMWQDAGISPGGENYLETGQGMGATLRIASQKGFYTLTDRATYLSQSDTLDLDIFLEGHPSLLNLYHVMSVNPERWELVNAQGARAWSDFLLSEETQSIIGAFGVDSFGQPLFFPDAGKCEDEFSVGIIWIS